MTGGYRGRFAPSPTGPLHAGSLVAALASWLDARSAGGRWLVRIEDVDMPRCAAGVDQIILAQLSACGLVSDEPPLWQSRRGALYSKALERLIERGAAYPCGCSRRDIERANAALGRVHERGAELIYPGTCRNGLERREARAWRFKIGSAPGNSPGFEPNRPDALVQWSLIAINSEANEVLWHDRRLGRQQQNVSREVGDFVLRRADGLWAYQLAVVVDDADQRITDVVRGEDLADNTARQILLQRALGVCTPRHLHTPLVLGADGQKLSKQNGAQPLDTSAPLAALNAAAAALGLAGMGASVADALATWVNQWRAQFAADARGTPDASLQSRCVIEHQTRPEPAPPGVPAPASDAAHPRRVRSYVLRAGRTTEAQARARRELAPRFELPFQPGPLDFEAAFGRCAPTIFEIGFGMGEATAHIAALRPQENFLCCEVHEAGVGALLKRIGEQGLSNVRIVQHDAVEVLEQMIPPVSLAGIHVFFPDPWHKKRHHKRRLIQPPLVRELAVRLQAGGYLHCATDWQPYAEQMLEVLSAQALLVNVADGYAPKPGYRPLTKFEQRGLKLGHGVWDLVFRHG